jgi:1-deoxy-D-xylulose-5-phosphate synthase
VGVIDPETGRAVTASGPTWTGVFSDELVKTAHARDDIVAITAAMLQPVGLGAFAEAFPDRVFDVGIAEQHAVASAAGLAFAGMHPVVAVYATFMNRAYDQVLLDVAMHRAAVTFVLDRAGVTGDDGASHNGMWDLSVFSTVPGLRVAAPRDGDRLRELFGEAVAVSDGPTMVRFPKGALPDTVPSVETRDGMDVLRRTGASDVLIVAVGPMASCALEVAERLDDQGIGVTVVDPRWVLPVPEAIPELARDHRLVVTIEDNLRVAGFGAAVLESLQDAGVTAPVHVVGLPPAFLEHAKRAQVLESVGLTAQQIARDVVERVSGLNQVELPDAEPSTPPSS